MRSVKQQNDRNQAVPATDRSRNANLARRGFLLTLGAGGAGAVAIAARSLGTDAAAVDAVAGSSDDGGYAATAHVRTYYKTARV